MFKPTYSLTGPVPSSSSSLTERLRAWKRVPEIACLAVYTALVAFAIAHHEPWADEAQAWQIARSLSPWQILHTYLHYEGSPGLWHIFLWVLIHSGISYTGMHWICGAVAVAGVGILLFRSPFPLYLRLLLPFTFFLAFQYAVVARSYVLVPLLLFLILACWKRNPLLLALLLGLLANLAAHATVMALAMALIYVIDRRHQPWPKKTLLLASCLLFAACAVALWTAYPVSNTFVAYFSSSDGPHPIPAGLMTRIIVGSTGFLTFGFADPWWLGIPFWLSVVIALARMHSLRFLAPVLFLPLFSSLVYYNFWHVGLEVLLTLAILWVVWDRLPAGRDRQLLQAAILFTVLIQIGWTVYAVNYDRKFDYSPDLATARFLAPYVSRGVPIASTYKRGEGLGAFYSVGLEPYFHQNLFINWTEPFWLWSRDNDSEKRFLASLPQAGIVVVEFYNFTLFNPQHDLDGNKNRLLKRYGYTFNRAFCATQPERFKWRAQICHLIYIRDGIADADKH